jgi:vacuolar-type H+-ATPase subunit E/Vma4
MALADIIKRIEADTEAEAAAIVEAAQAEADRVRREAERVAAQRAEHELERVRVEVAEEIRTRSATARLGGRDLVIGEKRAFIERAIGDAVQRVESLPDAEYAALLAREVAAVVRGGEVIEVGSADAGRLETALPAALAAAGVDARVSGRTDALERGVIVRGTRMSVEISAASMAEARRTELEALVAGVLFGEREAKA